MCKNMMIAGIKPEVSKKLLWDFLIAANEFMTASDQDGVGYVGQTSEGNLWGEKWLDPALAWRHRETWTAKDKKLKEEMKGNFEGEPVFMKFGLAAPFHTHAVLYHARMATCEKGLHNVHPFVRGKTGLIHNGVINNHLMLKKLISTCDSEVILNEYVDKGIMNDPNGISRMTKEFYGYYACGVLTTDKDGNQYMDIFRNPTAQLYAHYVKELDAVVYCTRDDIVRNTCRKLKWTFGSAFKIKDEVMLRINAKTGELVSSHKFSANSSYSGNRGYGGWNSGDYGSGNSDYHSYGHGSACAAKDDEKKHSSSNSERDHSGDDRRGSDCITEEQLDELYERNWERWYGGYH